MLAFPHILRYIALKISGLCIADRIFDFCRHSACLMYLQITKQFVILNAKRERNRIPLKRERIAAAAYAASQCQASKSILYASCVCKLPNGLSF